MGKLSKGEGRMEREDVTEEEVILEGGGEWKGVRNREGNVQQGKEGKRR